MKRFLNLFSFTLFALTAFSIAQATEITMTIPLNGKTKIEFGLWNTGIHRVESETTDNKIMTLICNNYDLMVGVGSYSPTTGKIVMSVNATTVQVGQCTDDLLVQLHDEIQTGASTFVFRQKDEQRSFSFEKK